MKNKLDLDKQLTSQLAKNLKIGNDDLNTDEMKKAFDYSDEELEKAKFKLYKKLKQDKTRLSFRIKPQELA